YRTTTESSGYFTENRQKQAAHWFRDALELGLAQLFYQHPAVKERYGNLEKKVLSGKISPFAAASELLDIFRK
ncbi:MAG: methylmalonyl Co-A mutase-associated GTPase MeaB, partial [Bacteroidota bacterium]